MEIGWKASGRRTTSGSLVLKREERPGGSLPETNISPSHQKEANSKGNPLISGKSRLVKYFHSVGSWKM